MPAYTFGSYVYFKNIPDQPEGHHISFILHQIPDMYITSPLKFLAEPFVSFPKISVKNIDPNINANIQIVLQL